MAAFRLLIVDDEPALLDLLQRYLSRLGYEVDTAPTPQAALEKFDADPALYALVVTDLTLPGMTGEEMLAHMRGKNSNLRGLISSGYPYEPTIEGIEFLQKPYLPKMLADTIEQLLK